MLSTDKQFMLLDTHQPSPLRNRLWWVLLLVVPYAISFSWLSFAAFWWPFVIFYAPLGLTSLLGISSTDDLATVLVHLVFWPIYLGAFIGSKRINALILRGVFVALAGLLVLTCYGCAANHVFPHVHMNCDIVPNHVPQLIASGRYVLGGGS